MTNNARAALVAAISEIGCDWESCPKCAEIRQRISALLDATLLEAREAQRREDAEKLCPYCRNPQKYPFVGAEGTVGFHAYDGQTLICLAALLRGGEERG